jgi:hypothetical protein
MQYFFIFFDFLKNFKTCSDIYIYLVICKKKIIVVKYFLYYFYKALFGKKSFFCLNKIATIDLKVCSPNIPLSKKKFFIKKMKTKQDPTQLTRT